MKKYNLLIISLAVIAFLESCYIYYEPIYRRGLDLLFVVPLIFALCILFFGKKIIPYHENGIGLKIYYSIIIVRYIVQPFLIIMSKGELNFRMPEASPNSYSVAILIYCIEILLACFMIKKWYPKYLKKYSQEQLRSRTLPLNIWGKSLLAIYALFLLVRIGSWLPGINVLGFQTAPSELVIVFDATIFNCLKVFLFIFFIIKSKKSIHKSFNFNLYLALAIITGLFNFSTYFGSNRSFIYETAIATISILIYIYPQYRKGVFLISMPFAIFIMFFSYVTKQFAEENMVTVTTVSTETATSNIVEEYANGLWTVARSYQSSLGLPIETSFEALVKDISDGFAGLGDLPGINAIIKALSNLKSSSEIFKNSLNQEDDRGQMLSLSGGFLIVGGEFLGWFVLFSGNCLMIMLLVNMDVRSKITKDIYYKYMYLWMAILMGLVHCYCLQTIIFCWSKFILFYWIVLYVNTKFANRQNKYIIKYMR